MAFCKLPSSIYFAIIFSACVCNYIENEDSLRRNLMKLLRGELVFNDRKIPFYKKELTDHTPKNHSEYDFIVIGAGSAGSVIASRLSEIKDVSVLLIEAGSKEYPIMDIPLFAPALQLSDQVNWKYESEPSDSYCLGMKGSKCQLPRGKVMGGSSVLNFMLATRGNKNDFNGWADSTGDESWSYKHMLKYFKKMERFEVKNVKFDSKYHGSNGPMYVSDTSFHTPLAEAFMNAGKELNYPTVDYNGEKQIGFSYFQSTVKNGERWSTNRAYLHPAKNRKNLILSRNSHVNKILVHPRTKAAYGVEFSKSGNIFQVHAKKEVILSAGAIGSPKILMLSGIGPAAHLHELGINVIKDAPVGENLMDHVAYAGLIFKVNDSKTYQHSNPLDPSNPALKAYVESKTGPFVLNAGFETLSYINTDDFDPTNENPDIEIPFGASQGLRDPSFQNIMGISEEYTKKMAADEFNHSAWSVFPVLLHPKSRGKVLLRSRDPNDKPRIYLNYLSEPQDVNKLIKSIRFIFKLSETVALKKYGSSFYDIPLPCGKYTFNSDDYWECALRTYTMTIYHQSGTCKMGRVNDATSVINSNLQVIGIKGLRVSDASIMPKIVSAHPNLPIIATAEKTADLIKSCWGY